MGELLKVHNSACNANGQLLVEKLGTFLQIEKTTLLLIFLYFNPSILKCINFTVTILHGFLSMVNLPVNYQAYHTPWTNLYIICNISGYLFARTCQNDYNVWFL